MILRNQKSEISSGLVVVLMAGLLSLVTPAVAHTDQVDIAWLLANGQATVMNTATDIGSIGSVFDGNTSSLARSQTEQLVELHCGHE